MGRDCLHMVLMSQKCTYKIWSLYFADVAEEALYKNMVYDNREDNEG
jgi:hypothetical protein